MSVTYEFSGGRFGDNLVTYLHAKWLSLKYGLPLLYKSFDYSSELVLHDRERGFETRHQFYRQVKLNNRQRLPSDFSHGPSWILVCPYFAEDPSDRWLNPNGYRFDVDWKDPEFRRVAREMVAPKGELNLQPVDPARVNVAIHVREGGGFDTDHTRLWDPLKLPPFHFYLEAFQKVLADFDGCPLYFHIFTDALDPSQLAAQFEQAVPEGADVRIGYRRENNHYSANVLDDFFSLFEFDALIHPQSNFSIVPSLINDYAIVYSPYNFVRQDGTITVTEIAVKSDETLREIVFKRIGRL